jgi:ABC-type multidrug transport system ATPase subunit
MKESSSQQRRRPEAASTPYFFKRVFTVRGICRFSLAWEVGVFDFFTFINIRSIDCCLFVCLIQKGKTNMTEETAQDTMEEHYLETGNNNVEEDGLQVTFHDSDVEEEIMFGGDDGDAPQKSSQQYFLRWSRLFKTVQVREATSGLLRGSIAGPQQRQPEEDGDDDDGKKQPSTTGPVLKTILNEVSAHAAPGKVLALIGPSGSGKTTLLNSLSGRTSLDSGVISVNGQSIRSDDVGDAKKLMKRFVSKVAYVQQEDIFFEDLTVRDQLAYTAFLRLPQAWSRASKLEEVDNIIRSLRLTKVQNSPIKMLSGGEKKRVNIGTELLTSPSCLFLDEPTSGLDSTSAVALVKLLQKLARSQQKTVLMSIHQPSSGMFLSFDSLLLLAEGHVVYFGTPKASIQYLKEKEMACPEGYNVADHWMDLLVTDSAIEEEEEYTKSSYFIMATDVENGHVSETVRSRKTKSRLHRERIQANRRTTRQQLIDAWESETVAEQIDQAVQAEKENEQQQLANDEVFLKYNTSWMAQYQVLMHRALKNSRSAIFTPLNMIKSGLLGVISGMLWFQLEYTEKTVQDRTAYFFFTMTYWVFDSMFGALMAFPAERKVILKVR